MESLETDLDFSGFNFHLKFRFLRFSEQWENDAYFLVTNDTSQFNNFIFLTMGFLLLPLHNWNCDLDSFIRRPESGSMLEIQMKHFSKTPVWFVFYIFIKSKVIKQLKSRQRALLCRDKKWPRIEFRPTMLKIRLNLPSWPFHLLLSSFQRFQNMCSSTSVWKPENRLF